MKPPPFAYLRPSSLEEACALLAEHGEDARLLAGGQSLIPALNFRLAMPEVLIDLHQLPDLRQLAPTPDGGLDIGAMCTQRAAECSRLVARQTPLLHMALPFVAHVPIRTRGTVGGSLAHNDPAAELPAVMQVLDATYHVHSHRGTRRLAATEFGLDLFTTALAPDEILTRIHIPRLASSHRVGYGFQEFARRHGDYALAGAAAFMSTEDGQTCARCRLAWFGLADGAIMAERLPAAACGQPVDFGHLEAVLADHLQHMPVNADMHADAAYRRHLGRIMGIRALRQAWAQATGTAARAEGAP